MIAEPDLASVRSDLQTLRSEGKEELAQQQGRGFFGTTIRDLADKVCQPHAFVYPWIICGRDGMCIDGPTTHSFMHNSPVRAKCELAHTSLQVGVEWKDSPTPPPSTKAPPVRALETGMDGAMDGAKQAMEGAKKAAEGAKKAAEFLKGVADKFSKKE